MWQAGSTGSACAHSLLSGDTYAHCLRMGQTHPATCVDGHRPSVTRNNFLCTHAITHTHTFTYSCSHTLSIPGFSKSQTSMPLLPLPPAAQTQLHTSPTQVHPSPLQVRVPWAVCSLTQHDFRRHCSLTVLNLFKPHGPRNAHSVIYLSREAGLNQGQIQLYHSSPGQVIVFRMMTLAIPTS